LSDGKTGPDLKRAAGSTVLPGSLAPEPMKSGHVGNKGKTVSKPGRGLQKKSNKRGHQREFTFVQTIKAGAPRKVSYFRQKGEREPDTRARNRVDGLTPTRGKYTSGAERRRGTRARKGKCNSFSISSFFHPARTE